jgi:hypothetical protein
MVVEPVVDALREDGRRLVHGLTAGGVEVAAAGWLQTAGDPKPYLYIATPLVDAGPLRPVYARIDQQLTAQQPSRVGPFDVRVVGANSPVARALRNYLRRYADVPVDTTVPDGDFVGVEVQLPVFIYALPAPAA